MPTENIDALKEYFTLWLEAGEQAYAEVAFTAEYSRNFGGLVNAFLAMRRARRMAGVRVKSPRSVPVVAIPMILLCIYPPIYPADASRVCRLVRCGPRGGGPVGPGRGVP